MSANVNGPPRSLLPAPSPERWLPLTVVVRRNSAGFVPQLSQDASASEPGKPRPWGPRFAPRTRDHLRRVVLLPHRGWSRSRASRLVTNPITRATGIIRVRHRAGLHPGCLAPARPAPEDPSLTRYGS